MDIFLQAAIDEAGKGLAEGGIPIGSVLVCWTAKSSGAATTSACNAAA